jgi:hypothetical protein
LVFAAVFAIIALWPLIGGHAPRLWAIVIAVVFLTLAYLWPAALRPLNVVWFKFGMLLGAVMTPVVMALLYVLVFVPTGLLMRLFGKDPLRMKPDPAKTSYWIIREKPGPGPGTMKRQF